MFRDFSISEESEFSKKRFFERKSWSSDVRKPYLRKTSAREISFLFRDCWVNCGENRAGVEKDQDFGVGNEETGFLQLDLTRERSVPPPVTSQSSLRSSHFF
ncbi:hypothetical protein U1Q18_005187 [Sarracenia purpurea var. burkii]